MYHAIRSVSRDRLDRCISISNLYDSNTKVYISDFSYVVKAERLIKLVKFLIHEVVLKSFLNGLLMTITVCTIIT